MADFLANWLIKIIQAETARKLNKKSAKAEGNPSGLVC
jgi:hypothetical protein